ncbi:MAG: hypothetical protein FJ358_01685 [Thaumarchaeota archaeon]|nr:hypothetical protein [Nitrososphaerota archaeon]
MPAFRMVALLSLGLIIGLGAGLGTGYTVFNPQIGTLQERLATAEGKAASVEAKYNDAVTGKERAAVLLQQAMKEKDDKIEALEADIASKNSQLLSLQNIKIDSEKIAAERLALEKQLEEASTQLKSLKGPDVRLVLFNIKSITKDGPDEHIITGYLVNFGSEDAKSASIEIEWQGPGGCACMPEIVKKERIDFAKIEARSIKAVSQTYSTDGTPVWHFSWQK